MHAEPCKARFLPDILPDSMCPNNKTHSEPCKARFLPDIFSYLRYVP